MVSKRTALGRSSKVEERAAREKEGHARAEKRIEGTGAKKWMRGAERERENKRRERPHESASVLA